MGIKILVGTAFVEPTNVERVLALGADDYMEKPLKTDKIRQESSSYRNWWNRANASLNWKHQRLSASGRRRSCGGHNSSSNSHSMRYRPTSPSSPRVYMTDAPSRARLIGIIILARFLKLPLTRYEAVIDKVEGSPMWTQLWPGTISANLFPRTQVLEPARLLTPTCIG